MRGLRLIHVLISVFCVSLLAASRSSAQDNFEMKKKLITGKPPAVTFESILVDSQEPLGKIIGSFKVKKYFAEPDTIYLKLKNPQVSPGDRFSIYSDLGPVKVPGTAFHKVGDQIHIKGFVLVTKVTPDAVIGKIYDSTIDIHIGDLIGPPYDLNVDLKVQEPTVMVRGKILASASSSDLIGTYDLAFIDKGSADGLRINDKLYVFSSADGSSKLKPGFPEVNKAELVVINVASHFATVYCTAADDTFQKGAYFKSAISEVKYLDQTKPNSATTPIQNPELPQTAPDSETQPPAADQPATDDKGGSPANSEAAPESLPAPPLPAQPFNPGPTE